MDTSLRLKSVPVFAALSSANLGLVAKLATKRYYPRGEFLCRQGEFGDTLYIIDSGEAILRQTDLQGLERPIGYLREGEAFGIDALLLGDAYDCSVQATTPLEALCIQRQDFERLLEEHPGIQKQLTLPRLVRERLRARSLPAQDKDEPWLLFRRRHWLVLARNLLLPFLILIALVIGVTSLNGLTRLPFFTLSVTVIMAFVLLWFYIDWRNDFYVVTTQRILHREQVILRFETRDEAPLAKIQNINIKRGLVGKLFNFGTMAIQTAGAKGATITLDYLPDPEGMKQVIFKQASHLKSRQKHEEQEEIRQELERKTRKDKTEEKWPIPPLPPEETPQKRGAWKRFWFSRPLLGLRYEQADRITWRKHWIFLVKRIYLALPAFVLITISIVIISSSSALGQRRLPVLLAALVLWIASVFWLWWKWEDWRNDEYIVTKNSIIDIVKKPLFFAEERKEASLDMIQNVSLKKPGPLAALLNFGDVVIQTAGPGGTFTFAGVHRPSEVQRTIFRRIEAYEEERKRQEREQRKSELSTWFQIYHEMEQQKKAKT
ncbi:MAG: cyclic nucleotide-binding domain-containing protein [Chloroflexi bacterium]|nr:cyclic nucleotide-binding domain-containing protein [Chloroflexota bacterium]